MSVALNLRSYSRPIKLHHCDGLAGTLAPHRILRLRLPPRRVSLHAENAPSEPSISSAPSFVSSIGPPPSPLQLWRWNLTNRHILMLNLAACAAAVSATWLFCSAIPALLAFKRASESLEKLLNVTREELPDTMAAIRLSGMEISDLTMELSDLGQEITQGVRSSTRAVRLAEDRLRRLTNMSPSVTLQEVAHPKPEAAGPVVARSARAIREGIVKGRAFWKIFFTLVWFSKPAFSRFASRAKS